MNNEQRRMHVEQEFIKRYGSPPTVWLRAPGRVDLMGSHTDYNLGYVLTLSIDLDTWIAARPRNDARVTIHSLNVGGGSTFDLHAIAHDEVLSWPNYVRGVAAVLRDQGYALVGFDGLADSTIPLGSGLSSSAALEVATAMVFKTLGGWDIEPVQLALLCQRAENEFVGMNCGILDQYTSIMGQAGCALLLDCRDVSSRPVPIAEDMCVVICDTRSKRELTGSEYSERRAQCEEGAQRLAKFYPGVRTLRDINLAQFAVYEADLPALVARRCRFILEENERVLGLEKGLLATARRVISALTAASYAGARDLYEIVSPEMERMMEAMLSAPGIIGARQAGAGFGGCMVAFVESSVTEAFAIHVKQAFLASTGIHPHVYPVRPAAGAGSLAG